MTINNPGSLPDPGATRPRALGKAVFVGSEKFHIRGVTYGTFKPNRFGASYPDPWQVRRDFSRIVEAGFNTVRTYTAPPEWVLDLASWANLRVMVGLAWEQHVAFLDEGSLGRSIERQVRRKVARCAGHPAILCYAVGNEIPSSIVRWTGRGRTEGFLHRLWAAAKAEDPEGLVTYVNYPSTEYLDLPFLDLLAFNVYLESTSQLSEYIARLHNLAGDRPLLMAELGLDSQRNGLAEQARVVSAQVRAAAEAGCAGSFVFSWTDEWHRGGRDVLDWDFGLTGRDRSPKPALAAVRRAHLEQPKPPKGRWPKISVVVCAYNAAATLGDCLRGLKSVDYPDYEVVVIDDGSTDETADIAAGFDVRLVSTENRGLSAARNLGIEAATGDIVAFIDADARPDEHWLLHLALSFERSEFVGMGGPNIAPPRDGRVAACVFNAPGGPVHVLRTDLEAEHVPGCNMAFRRWALQEVGGFDTRFCVAGDDVDLCWRIQERGWRIGFTPGAVVWHHQRSSVAAYWKQQRGYGVAEAMLEAKWPEKYNAAGHITWGGRLYGPGNLFLPLRRGRVYAGTWGQAPFQQQEPTPASLLWEAATMPEWWFGLLILTVLSLFGLAWKPFLLAAPLLAVGLGTTLARAVVGGVRARFVGESLTRWETLQHRALTAYLHFIQPLARLEGRFLSGLVPWRSRTGTRSFVWPWRRRFDLWRGLEESQPEVLSRLQATMEGAGAVVRSGGGYDDWDLEVEGGALGGARIRTCIEWHGPSHQLLRLAVTPRATGLAWAGVSVGSLLTGWAVIDGALTAAFILGSGITVGALRSLWERGTSVAAALNGIRSTVPEARAAARPPDEIQESAPVERPFSPDHEVDLRPALGRLDPSVEPEPTRLRTTG